MQLPCAVCGIDRFLRRGLEILALRREQDSAEIGNPWKGTPANTAACVRGTLKSSVRRFAAFLDQDWGEWDFFANAGSGLRERSPGLIRGK